MTLAWTKHTHVDKFFILAMVVWDRISCIPKKSLVNRYQEQVEVEDIYIAILDGGKTTGNYF